MENHSINGGLGSAVAELIAACEQDFDLSELTNVHDQELLLGLGLAEENGQ